MSDEDVHDGLFGSVIDTIGISRNENSPESIPFVIMWNKHFPESPAESVVVPVISVMDCMPAAYG